MTVKELKETISCIPDEYDTCELFTDVGHNEFADVSDIARIAEPKISGYKIPENRFYIGLITK